MRFEYPSLLWLLIAIPLIAILAGMVYWSRKPAWLPLTAPRLRPSLILTRPSFPRLIAFCLTLVASIGFILALARPITHGGKKTDALQSRNVIFALDLSRSMRVNDMSPDRLTHAKLIISDLIEALPNDQIGLIGFAGDAYEFSPLTIDHAAVLETLQEIDDSWAPYGGSNLAEVVNLASETFNQTGKKNNTLIILSDGEENDGNANAAIPIAQKSGTFIITIGVGTENGGFVPHPHSSTSHLLDSSGRPVISRLMPSPLQKLAAATQGTCILANTGSNIPSVVKSSLSQISTFEVQGRERTINIELYQWFLCPAFLLLLAAYFFNTRWLALNPTSTTLSLLLLLACTPIAYANPSDLGSAHTAYQQGDFLAARQHYSQALRSNQPATVTAAHDGLGNCLFQIGWTFLSSSRYPNTPPSESSFDELVQTKLDELAKSPATNDNTLDPNWQNLILNWTDSIRHFDSILTQTPDHPSARHNRLLVYHYLIRLEQLLNEEKNQTANELPPPPSKSPDSSSDPNSSNDPNSPPPNSPDQNPPNSPKSDPKSDPKSSDTSPPPSEDPSHQAPQDKPKDPKSNPKESSKQGTKSKDKPDLSPEEQAKSMLKENADLEKGPVTPGRRLLKIPAKDW